MEEWNNLLTCTVSDVIRTLEQMLIESDRYISYQAVINSDAFNEEIFVTINVEDATGKTKNKYELKRTRNMVSLKDITNAN